MTADLATVRRRALERRSAERVARAAAWNEWSHAVDHQPRLDRRHDVSVHDDRPVSVSDGKAMSSSLVRAFQSMSIGEWRNNICHAISERGTLHRYERKAVLFQQGTPSATVYAIESGLVEISGVNSAGHEVTTSIRGAGEHFGWAEGLLGETRTRQATVLQDAELWELGIVEFLDMLVERPEIMLSALGSAVYRETRFAGMRYDLRGSSAYVRVAYALRLLAASAHDEQGGTPRLRVTHEEISRMCELSRQTVTTILGEMQRNGIVRLGLRSINILDRDWLERHHEPADGAKSWASDFPPSGR